MGFVASKATYPAKMTQTQNLAIDKTFSQIIIEPKGENDYYTINGLPENSDFRRSSSYQEIKATSLKIEGYAFATGGMQLGEYQKAITVRQKTENGMAEILLED